MRQRPAHVTDKDGNQLPAMAIVCAECGNDAFCIFIVKRPTSDHQHLQCTECGVSFCDGTCV